LLTAVEIRRHVSLGTSTGFKVIPACCTVLTVVCQCCAVAVDGCVGTPTTAKFLHLQLQPSAIATRQLQTTGNSLQ